METYLFIIIGIGIFAFVGYTIYKKKIKPAINKLPDGTPTTQFSPDIREKLDQIGGWTDYQKTPGGVNVYSVVMLPAIALRVVEEAVKLEIALMKHYFPQWTRFLSMSEFEINFIKPDGISPEAKQPYLLVGGVMSAGTIGTGTRPLILLPHYEANNWTMLEALFYSTLAEGEHLVELNDATVFQQFTGAGDRHPHREIPADLLATVPADILSRGMTGFRAQPKLLGCGFQLAKQGL